MEPSETTHFGYQTVSVGRYDLMNDLMSLGAHRRWKRFAIRMSGVRTGDLVLDLAGGTGDLSSRLLPLVGPKGRVVLSDINASMLQEGRRRLIDEGAVGNIAYAQIDAERLPFADNTFDCITIGFGLRNVTDKDQVLASMYRALKPGGRAVILEFSHPIALSLKTVYDLCSFAILPILGKLVANDAASYRYLAESIRVHPNQDTLLKMMRTACFEHCQYFNLTGGIVAVHRGYKF